MIAGSVDAGGLDDLIRLFDGFERDYLADLRALAGRIRDFVVEAHARGLKAGIDAEGNRMAPLKDSTLKRKGRGSGAPTVPHGDASRLIANFDARVLISNDGKDVVIRATYGGFEAAKYFDAGTAHMARRVVTGIRPADMEAIYGMCGEFMRGQAERFG